MPDRLQPSAQPPWPAQASTACLAVVLALVTACAGPQVAADPWQARLDRDHPLVGRIWDARAQALIAPDDLLAALGAADFVLLGEQHDHPDHHRLQAEVVAALLQRAPRRAVLFEMLEPAQEAPLAAWRAAHPDGVAGLDHALRWAETGWPDFAMYQPIFAAAVRAGAPIRAANLPRTLARAVARQGLDAVEPAQRRQLALDLPFPATAAQAMQAEVVAAHCGMLPATAAPPMAQAQQARDAAMADAMLRADQGAGAVLIAGKGHVRTDRAVPWWLRQRAPARQVVAVAFAPVRPGLDPRAVAADLAADFVWFTPRLDDVDPCAAFRKQLEGLRSRP